MTKDPVILGTLAGFFGNIFKEVIGWTMYAMGILEYTFPHVAAGLYVPEKFVKDPASLIIGIISDWTLAAIIASIILSVNRKTGKDFIITKSVIFASATYIFVYGALMALDVTRTSILAPLQNLLLYFPHLVFGVGVGWFIDRYDA